MVVRELSILAAKVRIWIALVHHVGANCASLKNPNQKTIGVFLQRSVAPPFPHKYKHLRGPHKCAHIKAIRRHVRALHNEVCEFFIPAAGRHLFGKHITKTPASHTVFRGFVLRIVLCGFAAD
jgi:hypothetical protein